MRPLAVFIAGPWDSRYRIRGDAIWLLTSGEVRVVSSWLTRHEDTRPPVDVAKQDLEDLSQADALLLDTLDGGRGGREVELGVMLAGGFPVVRIGPVRTVYHELALAAYPHWLACREDWPRLRGVLRATQAQEVPHLHRAFLRMLATVSADGQRKRRAGLKVPWWRDPGHWPALERHVARHVLGQKVDPDSGQHPLVHVAWRALAVVWQETEGLVNPGPGDGEDAPQG
ncbi:MAG: DUF5664 domain-containing protein [Armatimonadota bacterium]|nr:DUF5664 domain-containing protein [Armatimonadota bacterium]